MFTVKHPILKKGNKKVNLHYLKCWIGIHNFKYLDSQIFDLLNDKNDIVGHITFALYYCTCCGKENLRGNKKRLS